MTSILQLIRRSHAELRKSERKVADYVLAQADDVIHMRIVDLAQEAHVSEPTVVRFCRAIGYNSFQSFKLALAQYVAHYPRLSEHAVANGGQSLDTAIAALEQLARNLDDTALDRAAALLHAAPRIFIALLDPELAGAAAQAQVGLLARGRTPVLPASPLTALDLARLLTDNDVLLQLGAASVGTELVASAAKQGAHAIVLGTVDGTDGITVALALPASARGVTATALIDALLTRLERAAIAAHAPPVQPPA